MCRYGASNIGFSIYYDKVFKKEYMPSRIRYNQFFFYSVLGYCLYNFYNKVRYHYDSTDTLPLILNCAYRTINS